jgi:hypothetical protein
MSSQTKEIRRLSFKPLLLNVLGMSLLPELINIIYEYAIRYTNPMYYGDRKYTFDFNDYKYLCNHDCWYDRVHDILYMNVFDKIITTKQYMLYNESLPLIGQSIDVYNNNMCVAYSHSSAINILNKNTLDTLYTFSIHNDIHQCLFLTNNMFVTLYGSELDTCVSIHDVKTIFKSICIKNIVSIGINHDYIFMITIERVYDKRYSYRRAILLIYDHELRFIRKQPINIINYDYAHMKVYDDTIYISKSDGIIIYKMNPL